MDAFRCIGMLVVAILICAVTAARADDLIAAWECDDARVELHRQGVHMFTLHLDFDTETRTKPRLPKPLYFNHDHNGEPIGRFDLRFDKKGTILNGKRCRVSCRDGKECE
jgi:hypothetical protein